MRSFPRSDTRNAERRARRPLLKLMVCSRRIPPEFPEAAGNLRHSGNSGLLPTIYSKSVLSALRLSHFPIFMVVRSEATVLVRTTVVEEPSSDGGVEHPSVARVHRDVHRTRIDAAAGIHGFVD